LNQLLDDNSPHQHTLNNTHKTITAIKIFFCSTALQIFAAALGKGHHLLKKTAAPIKP